MIRRPPRSTQCRSSAASDVYKRQVYILLHLYGWCIESQRVANNVVKSLLLNIISKESTQPFSLNLSTRLGAHNAQRWTASIGNKMGIWQNMLTAVGNKTDNYHVSSADNPVTRVIATIYGNRVVTVKDRLSCHLSPSLCLTGRAGYFFRETVRSADQPERYRDFTGGLRMNWNISSQDDLQASYAFDQYDKSDYQRITHPVSYTPLTIPTNETD
mgnify:CR=1 FL=1